MDGSVCLIKQTGKVKCLRDKIDELAETLGFDTVSKVMFSQAMFSRTTTTTTKAAHPLLP